MDDIVAKRETLFPKLTTVEELVTVVKPGPKSSKEYKTHPLEPSSAFYLLPNENVKGRYLALKSANDRQVVATGFTRTRAFKNAIRKGYSSCIIIAND